MTTPAAFHLVLHDDVPRKHMLVDELELGDYAVQYFEQYAAAPIGSLPEGVRARVSPGRPVDYLGNGIGLSICSPRFIAIAQPFLRPGDVEWLDLPMFDTETGQPIGGHKVLHPLHVIETLDLDRSKVVRWKNKKKRIPEFIATHVFDAKRVPEGLHVFRPLKDPYQLVFSDALAQAFVGTGVVGLAFKRCRTP